MKKDIKITCALCNSEDKKAKSNTHYLTDFVIKTALNEDGSGLKNKGFYFGFDPTKPFVDFKFQQHASTGKIENVLGRQSTEEENYAARYEIDFSVHDKFCDDCENKFGIYETAFADTLLNKFRKQDLTDIDEIILIPEESRLFRMFFLMQIWRTSVCHEGFTLSPETSEILRIKIHDEDYEGLENFPLSVMYLQTLKTDESQGEEYKTNNIVGVAEGYQNNLILMNDFIIQYVDDINTAIENYENLYEPADYPEFLNHQQEEFKIKIVQNSTRSKMLTRVYTREAQERLKLYMWFLWDYMVIMLRRLPTYELLNAFRTAIITNNNFSMHTNEGFKKFFDKFLRDNNLKK